MIDSDRWRRIQEIFHGALERAPADRSAYVRQECRYDLDLIGEVNSLLAYDSAERHSIESAIRAVAGSAVRCGLAGASVGAWLLVREIGRGGMGSVYLAERNDREFQKRAAVKVIRHGLDTSDVLARFRYERQILAGLDHRGIAKLLDGAPRATVAPTSSWSTSMVNTLTDTVAMPG